MHLLRRRNIPTTQGNKMTPTTAEQMPDTADLITRCNEAIKRRSRFDGGDTDWTLPECDRQLLREVVAWLAQGGARGGRMRVPAADA